MKFQDAGIFGADISTYQDSPDIPGTVNFETMKSFGASFVGFRASNGLYQDQDFETYKKNVQGVLPWFAYHYYNNHYEPKAQARKFFDVLAPDIPNFVVLDLEDKNSGYMGLTHWYNFLEEFKRVSGLSNDRIWIYTNETYIAEKAGRVTPTELSYLKKYKLWLASYFIHPAKPNYQFVLVPFPWTDDDVYLLQTGTPNFGIQMGVESREIDYNIFNGDENKFKEIFGTSPTQPEEHMITLTADLKTGNDSRLRMGAGLSYSIIRVMTGPLSIQGIGEKIQADGYWWIEIISPYSGWVALTTSYENVVYTPPVTPAEDHLEIYINGVKTIDMTGKLNLAG